MSFDRNKYFERIGYTGQSDISVKTLREIHAAQVFSIPFENLAIHESKNVNNLNDFIALDEASLFGKLIVDKRGGYCHENNELLAIALTQIGFKVERLAARVLTAPNLPRGHKLLLVTIDNQKWIADVGFGGYGLYEPIPLVADKEEIQYDDHFKLVINDDKYVLQFQQNNVWKNLYEFNLEKFEPVDFKPMSYHVSHAPDSFFVANRFCVMPTPKGRIILLNEKLRIMENGKEEVTLIKDEENYLFVLKNLFGILLPKNTVLKEHKSINIESRNKENISQTNNWCNQFPKAASIVSTANEINPSDNAVKSFVSTDNNI